VTDGDPEPDAPPDPVASRSTRRGFLAGAAAATAALAGCTGDGGSGETTTTTTTAETTTATATTTATTTTTAGPMAAIDEWLADTSNYDGSLVDATDRSEVTVAVGAEGNAAFFAFDPPAIRVSPDTTVVWEWTGQGNQHNVVDRDGAFESELTSEEGHTFSHTFGEAGLWLYYCAPHQGAGMKGAVLVG